ncbi:MAG TPA: EamA family transporter [Actinomycetota bacterium]|nr:EamA family transporter [Actinomycetota bacterium]
MRLRAGYPEILTCTLAWGAIGSIVNQVTLPSSVIVLIRLILGAIFVFTYIAARGRLSTLKPGARPALLVTAGVVLGVHWATLFEAYQRIGVVTTILIVFVGPVLWAAASPLVGEPLHARVFVALGVAFAGIVLICIPDIEGMDGVGLAAAITSAVLFAVLVLQGKVLTRHYEPAAIVAWQLSIAALALSPALLQMNGREVMRAAPALLVLGLVHSGFLGILFFRAVRALDPQRLGVLFYLEPASAVFYAWLFLREEPALTTLIGGGLVLGAGIAIIVMDRDQAPPLTVAGETAT